MRMSIQAVGHPLLKAYIQYYVFTEYAGPFTYRTFPNTNLCLTLYRQNRAFYTPGHDINSCRIGEGGAAYSSALWGWHRKPFEVMVEAPSEQACIVFHPGGLRKFTAVPLAELQQGADAFEQLFGTKAGFLPEQLFDAKEATDKVALLESFLLRQFSFRSPQPGPTDWAIQAMIQQQGNLRVEELARRIQANPATLYRKFMAEVGQPPKDFMNTLRFRAALSDISARPAASLTQIGYEADYFDQSHFIKSFRKMAGATPRLLRQQLSLAGGQIAWIVN